MAFYQSTAGQAIPGSNTITIIDYGTKVIDTHSAVTTGASWVFTAPKRGYYHVSARCAFTSTFDATSSRLAINKNGATLFVTVASTDPGAVPDGFQCAGTVFLDRGGTVNALIDHNDASGAEGLSTTATENNITIVYIGS